MILLPMLFEIEDLVANPILFVMPITVWHRCADRPSNWTGALDVHLFTHLWLMSLVPAITLLGYIMHPVDRWLQARQRPLLPKALSANQSANGSSLA